jgi:hypothetical protein
VLTRATRGPISLTLLQLNILVGLLASPDFYEGAWTDERGTTCWQHGSRTAGFTSCYGIELAGSIRPFDCEFSSVDWLSSDPEPGDVQVLRGQNGRIGPPDGSTPRHSKRLPARLALTMKALVQILLPLYDKDGERFSLHVLEEIERDLTSQFGGVTSFSRSPARGRWVDERGGVERDEVIVCEVMVPAVDREWWLRYKDVLARRLGQSELVVRSLPLEIL